MNKSTHLWNHIIPSQTPIGDMGLTVHNDTIIDISWAFSDSHIGDMSFLVPNNDTIIDISWAFSDSTHGDMSFLVPTSSTFVCSASKLSLSAAQLPAHIAWLNCQHYQANKIGLTYYPITNIYNSYNQHT
jgi:hypothetical protein